MEIADRLMPGYVQQGFCYTRGKLLMATADFVEKNNSKLICSSAVMSVQLLNTTLLFVELPLKMIEDVALTAINLLGVLFSDRCRKNFAFCADCLISDIFGVFNRMRAGVSFIVDGIFSVYFICKGRRDVQLLDLKDADNFHFQKFWYIEAVRKQGAEKSLLFTAAKKFIYIEDRIEFYKACSKMKRMNREQLIDLIAAYSQSSGASRRATPSTPTEPWACPAALQEDQGDISQTTQRILKASHGVDMTELNKEQQRSHVCILLSIPPTSSDSDIAKKRRTLLLSLHSDKLQECNPDIRPHAEQAFREFTNAWSNYQS